MQRTDGMARAYCLVRGFGGQPGFLAMDMDEGTQLGLQCLDAAQTGLDNIHRGKTPRFEAIGQGMDGKVVKIHGSASNDGAHDQIENGRDHQAAKSGQEGGGEGAVRHQPPVGGGKAGGNAAGCSN